MTQKHALPFNTLILSQTGRLPEGLLRGLEQVPSKTVEADENFPRGSGFPQDHHRDLAEGRQRGQEKRGAGHTPSPREAAGVAGAQASLKPWVPAAHP